SLNFIDCGPFERRSCHWRNDPRGPGARHCQTVRSRSRDSAEDQPPFRRRKRRRRMTARSTKWSGCRPATWARGSLVSVPPNGLAGPGGNLKCSESLPDLLWRRRPCSKCRHGLVIKCNQRQASKELGKKLVSPHWWALWYALMKIVQSVGAW